MFKPKFDFGDTVYWVADMAVHAGTVLGITIVDGYCHKEDYEVIVPSRLGYEHYNLDVRELYSSKEDAEAVLKGETKHYKRMRITHLEDAIKKVELQLATLMQEKEELEKEIK